MMDKEAMRKEAVLAANQALLMMSARLTSYTSEKFTWNIDSTPDVITIELRIGRRETQLRSYRHEYFLKHTDDERCDIIVTLYHQYIAGQPDLLQRRFAAELYACVAQLCGARSDIVRQFSIQKNDGLNCEYMVTLRNYAAGLIQQSFSSLLMQNDCVMDLVRRTIKRMISMLEDWPNVQ